MIILIKLINPSQSIPTFASVNPQAPSHSPEGGEAIRMVVSFKFGFAELKVQKSF